MRGFGSLIIILVVMLSMMLALFFGWQSYMLEDANKFLKERISVVNQEIAQY